MSLFDSLDDTTGESHVQHEIIKAPFGWPGGKSKSLKQILPHLQYRKTYVEPFGGSFAVGLARTPSTVEVYNDRYGGICDFYRVLRDPVLLPLLCTRLELTVYSREEFVWSKTTWENVQDPVERAARWYYMIMTSFGCLGRNYGRSMGLNNSQFANKIHSHIKGFGLIHQRMSTVQIENMDWFYCIQDYDSPDTVFYIDPPYIDASSGIYDHEMETKDYMRLIDAIFSAKGFCALSGYADNPIFDNRPWDDKITWDAFVSIETITNNERNCRASLGTANERGTNKECLWIKY